MNDEVFQPETTPSWLTAQPATQEQPQPVVTQEPQPAVDPAQAWLAPTPSEEAQPPSEEAQQPQPPPEHPGEHDEAEFENVSLHHANLVSFLIEFKRFWLWPAGTSNEADSAHALASMIIGAFKKDGGDDGAQS
jgi:hypothetical protein